MIPFSQAGGALVEELKKEIGQEHSLYYKKIRAVAKWESNDDVLYVTGDELGTDIYYIFYLTYSKQNLKGFPKYKRFTDIRYICSKRIYRTSIYKRLYVGWKWSFIEPWKRRREQMLPPAFVVWKMIEQIYKKRYYIENQGGFPTKENRPGLVYCVIFDAAPSRHGW